MTISVLGLFENNTKPIKEVWELSEDEKKKLTDFIIWADKNIELELYKKIIINLIFKDYWSILSDFVEKTLSYSSSSSGSKELESELKNILSNPKLTEYIIKSYRIFCLNLECFANDKRSDFSSSTSYYFLSYRKINILKKYVSSIESLVNKIDWIDLPKISEEEIISYKESIFNNKVINFKRLFKWLTSYALFSKKEKAHDTTS